ncbi:unnamed protein product [Discosporangium mesarthrocarpum]
MRDRTRVQKLMPLMREFGSLERKRLGAGVTPLEYQRWLDLKGQIGHSFAKSRRAGLQAMGGSEGKERPTRLLVEYRDREHLLESIVSNLQPAGFFVATPFAAEVGVTFSMRVSLEEEGEVADVPVVVATSISQGAHTLSTMSMGMSVKILKPTPAQGAGISKLFASQLDEKLGLNG